MSTDLRKRLMELGKQITEQRLVLEQLQHSVTCRVRAPRDCDVSSLDATDRNHSGNIRALPSILWTRRGRRFPEFARSRRRLSFSLFVAHGTTSPLPPKLWSKLAVWLDDIPQRGIGTWAGGELYRPVVGPCRRLPSADTIDGHLTRLAESGMDIHLGTAGRNYVSIGYVLRPFGTRDNLTFCNDASTGENPGPGYKPYYGRFDALRILCRLLQYYNACFLPPYVFKPCHIFVIKPFLPRLFFGWEYTLGDP
ncbi:hypothetical protein B0H14DRAFT_3609117 [Mycena olivaceomarginata]|nr:hypothetical protein B0H14DRAFT_3609117 [Mycena olivaceomarginata]